jgi:thiamine-monophosphate kinase
LAGLDPAVVAKRSMAVNVSDLAAVGAVPAYGLLALSAPRGFDHRRFLRALGVAAKGYGVTLAGGDVAHAPLVVASLTLLGTPPRRALAAARCGAARRRTVGRGHARRVGAGAVAARARRELARKAAWSYRRTSILDAGTQRVAKRAVERHLSPQPQLELSAALVRQRRCACIDVSDGLSSDLTRLTAASGVGATVDGDALPLPKNAARLTVALGAHPLELALGGGEDYVLLFALPATAKAPAGCVRIGEIEKRAGLRLRRGEKIEELPALGWDHVRA